jgi:hypothetical protein
MLSTAEQNSKLKLPVSAWPTVRELMTASPFLSTDMFLKS